MPRLFWLALLLGYLAGIGGAVLFLPELTLEPLSAGLALASVLGAGVLALVVASRSHDDAPLVEEAGRPAVRPAQDAAARGPHGCAPDAAGTCGRLITTAAEDGISTAELCEILLHGRVDAFVRRVTGLRQSGIEFYHAMARLRTAGGAHLEPDRWRSMAARSGLQGVIDQLLVARCAQALRTAEADGHGLGMFCRIAPTSPSDPAFLDGVGGPLRDHPDLAGRLVLELEQTRLPRPGRETLAVLVEQGVRLCLWRTGIEGLDPRALAAQGFAFVRVEVPAPAVSTPQWKLDPRLLALRGVLQQAGITLVLDPIGAPRRLLSLADGGAGLGEGETMRCAGVA